ncbi:heme A synthase [bacterium]|nr:heme A synthase [bacterium]
MTAAQNIQIAAGLHSGRGAAAVRVWLLVIALLVYAMILVGGATRLTDSGLSITEWKPITGAVPPLSDADWMSEFDKYRSQTAEYRDQNAGMSLAEFQYIYWWEWGHRQLGRLIGVVFLIPFAVFWLRGFLTPALRGRLLILFSLGGLQAAIGWWMVSSGVGDTDRLDVAPYRLMTHFGLALLIIGYCVWLWLDLGPRREPSSRAAARWATGLLWLTGLQMALGALVAGLDAGRGYTDWPLMSGQVIPRAMWVIEPWWRNLFENEATTQFLHRMTAYVLLFAAFWAAWRRKEEAGGAFGVFAGLTAIQVVLGVITLVNAAPVGLGLMHQATGAALFVTAVVLVWRTRAVELALGQDTVAASEGAPDQAAFKAPRST